MKTSVIGYPRIGALRELKFACEKYFKGNVTESELFHTAKHIRCTQWTQQRENGLDFIPSNDFSLYDNVLDTAVLFNIIPDRYKALGLSALDTYFAMARGYQGDKGDVKALAMKKWFNTNYHYIVPEADDGTELKLTGTKPFDEFREALELGIQTKPVITGAFTLLKLVRFTGTKTEKDFIAQTAEAYAKILEQFAALGAEWVQFDEPYLVFDLSADDIALFQELYRTILERKSGVKVLLQTYFGDIRDCYREAVSLPFDGIGMDFLEGKQSLSLVLQNGFPQDKALFAGVVNGKNIWKNQYSKTVTVVEELKKQCSQVVLSTSCSLLHVPYTLKNETALDEKYTKHFAFAEEKLSELSELKAILDSNLPCQTEEYAENAALFAEKRDSVDKKVQEKVNEIQPSDFFRLPEFSQREKIQKEKYHLPILPTTTIGSFPQTAEVKANRRKWKDGAISDEDYIKKTQEQIAECVAFQESIGLDVLVHGEFERNDMVEYFGENLSGYLFTEKAWVQSYGTRCVKPPVIWGDVGRKKPMTVAWSVYAQSLTKKPMKGMLTGPVTILNWSFPREDISLKESAYQIALAIREETLDLEKNGINIIQIDEAALREKLPLRKSDWYSEYLDWAIPAFRLVHSGVKPQTQIHTHMCYSEFTDIIPAIENMDADVITFEASRSDLQILQSLHKNHFKTQVGPGVYDIHSPRIPSVAEMKDSLHKMLKIVSKEKLWVNPDCGLKTRGVLETKPSLKNLVEAAKEVRNENI